MSTEAAAMVEDASSNEEYTIQGVTGVDVVLNVAGPGSRSYAFIIDWHIRVGLVLALWLFAYLLAIPTSTLFSGNVSAWIILVIMLPAAIIYFFYHPVFELLMRGQTPGKRMAGIRIVTRDGGIPGAGAILIRNIFRLIDSLPAFYLIGLITAVFSKQRVRIGDMAAGTLLIVDEPFKAPSIDRIQSASQSSSLDVVTLDLITQILDRWHSLDGDKRISIAQSILKRIDKSSSVEVTHLNETALYARLDALLKDRHS